MAHQHPARSDDDSRAPAAVVDLGTQCALLLIARRAPGGGLDVVEDHALHPRLGAGLVEGGSLAAVAVERTLEVLATYARRMDLAGVAPERRRVIATAPLRLAADAREFVRRVAGEIGLEVRVLAAGDEARLARRGALGDADDGSWFVLEVGGGSTQCSGPRGAILTAAIGAVQAAERWLARPGGWAALREGAERAFAAWPARAAQGAAIAVAGGTAANLACIVRGAESYDPRCVDGTPLEVARVRAEAERLAHLPLEALLDLPIEPARAPVLAAGVAILASALEHLGPARARVAARGLRHAIATELLAAP